MDSVRLNSGDFDDSVCTFGSYIAMMQEAQRQFRLSIDKLVNAMGMHAENQVRLSEGKSLAYDEAAFQSI